MIDANREYTLKEILDNKLIPQVTGYTRLYNLITIRVVNVNKKMGWSRKMAEETTPVTIKPVNVKPGWQKINSKITIKGVEIIKFLSLHNITNI